MSNTLYVKTFDFLHIPFCLFQIAEELAAQREMALQKKDQKGKKENESKKKKEKEKAGKKVRLPGVKTAVCENRAKVQPFQPCVGKRL